MMLLNSISIGLLHLAAIAASPCAIALTLPTLPPSALPLPVALPVPLLRFFIVP